MNKKPRIAVVSLGGSISYFRDPKTQAVFLLENTKDLSPFLKGMHQTHDIHLIKLPGTQQYFLGLSDWNAVYNIISKKIHQFDGFVILQETDTLLFGSGILSFMLSQCQKPVVFTSSPTVLGDKTMHSIAEKNLKGAIIAASSNIGEVCIFCNGELHRANRAKRQSIQDSSPFFSYQTDPIGTIFPNGNLSLNIHRIHRDDSTLLFPYAFPTTPIEFVRLFPGYTSTFLQRSFATTSSKALVVETLGYGSLSPSVLEELRNIAKKGLYIVLIAEHDTHERQFRMDSDAQSIPNGVLLKNMSIWGSFAKTHIALENSNTPKEFKDFLTTPIACDIVE